MNYLYLGLGTAISWLLTMVSVVVFDPKCWADIVHLFS